MEKKLKNMLQTMILLILTSSVIIALFLLGKNEKRENSNKISKKEETSVCKVNNNYYGSLLDALANNSDNSVIEIIKDINEPIKIVNRNLTIEGNNHKIEIIEKWSDFLGVIEIIDSNITIKNLKIVASENLLDTGIYITGSNIYLDNIIIRNCICEKEMLTRGVCIYYVNDKTESSSIEIRNSKFENYSRSALYIENKNKNQDEIVSEIKLMITNNFFEPIKKGSTIGIIVIGKVIGAITNNEFKNMLVEKSYAIYQNTDENQISYQGNFFNQVYQSIYQQIN